MTLDTLLFRLKYEFYRLIYVLWVRQQSDVLVLLFIMVEEHPERPNVFLGKPYQRKGLGDAIQKAIGGQFYRENAGSEGGVSGAHQGWEVVNGSLSN